MIFFLVFLIGRLVDGRDTVAPLLVVGRRKNGQSNNLGGLPGASLMSGIPCYCSCFCRNFDGLLNVYSPVIQTTHVERPPLSYLPQVVPPPPVIDHS